MQHHYKNSEPLRLDLIKKMFVSFPLEMNKLNMVDEKVEPIF